MCSPADVVGFGEMSSSLLVACWFGCSFLCCKEERAEEFCLHKYLAAIIKIFNLYLLSSCNLSGAQLCTWVRVVLMLVEIVGALWLSASVSWMCEVQGSLAWVVSPAQAGLGVQDGRVGGKRRGVGQQDSPDVEKCGVIIDKLKL